MKMKAILYTTEKEEFLVRKDGELLSQNKSSPLERMLAFRIEFPNGKTKYIKNALKIPGGSKIIFYAAKFIETKSTGRIIEEKSLETDPIISRVPFNEKETEKYLSEH